jgi:hypothetical protein
VLGIGRLLQDTHLTLEQQQFCSMINTSGQLLLTIISHKTAQQRQQQQQADTA